MHIIAGGEASCQRQFQLLLAAYPLDDIVTQADATLTARINHMLRNMCEVIRSNLMFIVIGYRRKSVSETLSPSLNTAVKCQVCLLFAAHSLTVFCLLGGAGWLCRPLLLL